MDTDKYRLEKTKAALRSEIRATLKSFPVEKRAADSVRLCAKLKEQFFFQSAATVLFFAPLPDEVEVWPLLQEAFNLGKNAALPQFNAAAQNYVARRVQNLQSEIVPGQFQVREPKSSCAEIPLDKIDLVHVPGVAFDLRGNRLGRGKGFYDRLLAEIRGAKCGVAFDEQVVKQVPVEESDAPVDFILTPVRCLAAAQ
jgi:5-formyltetrahydrofolate cyclo-ligase